MKDRLPETLSARELRDLLAQRGDVLVLDVLPEDHYARLHLPSARNACVYKVSFADDVAELASDRSTPIVAYGSGDGTLASKVAADKLRAAGFGNVADFRGGLSEWRREGLPIEGEGGEPETSSPAAGRWIVDADASNVNWSGRNLGSTHTGTLRVSDGEGRVKDGRLAGACVVIDMTSIHCTDLKDRKMAGMLEKHLRSDDFFDTDQHPRATFTITDAQPVEEATPGTPNMDFAGDLTIKDITHRIRFKGHAGMKGGRLVVRACFDFDRTRWNVLYGSGRFFESLGMHLVDDGIGLEFRLLLDHRP